ncbi:MAG: DUF2726 domain-containing protein [Caldilineaceae bacterium]|nr:DUF2726 domain-containing protein [Caldilineaceae bacterium]
MSTYRIQETILEHSERSLYHALSLVVAQRALILTKVQLSAILAPTAVAGQHIAYTHLDRYTVDFVLCDRYSTRPIVVIQQDDGTGAANVCDAIERLTESCGLPLVRVPSQSAYRMDRLLRLIEPYLNDDKRGRDYATGDRCAGGKSTNAPEAKTPVVPRPATLFSAN